MSDAELLARFAQDFAIPYLSGQRCVVGDFVGDAGRRVLPAALSVSQELDEALEGLLLQGALHFDVTPAPFDEDAGTLLVAVHELFAACHPQAQSFYASTPGFCQSAEQAVRGLTRTYDASRLLARHLVLAPALHATRTDVLVRWWSGGASYYGEEPPARLLSWPGWRRVDVERHTTPMWQLAMLEGDEGSRLARTALLQTLLDFSPLTRLVLLGDDSLRQLGFSLVSPLKHRGRRMSPLHLLDDPRLARAVTDLLLERGLDKAGPMLALALLAGVRETVSPWVLRRAVEFCVHLALVSCLAAEAQADAPEAQPIRTLCEGDPATLPESMQVFWAVVAAAHALDGSHLLLPRPDDLPVPARRRWLALKQALDHPGIERVAAPLVRELRRRLAPASAPFEPADEARARAE